MKIAIVDDDSRARDSLRACLTELLGSAPEISVFPGGGEFLAVWKKGAFDLVILDIFMDRLTGMEVAYRIRETDRDVRIVFSTSSNEYASESYEVDASYYLRKPFGTDRVRAMLGRLDLPELERSRTVTLPDGTAVVLRDILYADCAAHKVTLHCTGGRSLVLRAPFSAIEPLLCAHPFFFSPCKGVVVNFYAVTAQTGDAFTLSDGSRLPISRRRAKEVQDAYSTFWFDRMRKDGEC